MAIVAFSGHKQVGKDTAGSIVQYLQWRKDNEYIKEMPPISEGHFDTYRHSLTPLNSKWKNVKFADKLKDIVCILIGCTREDLENEVFKDTSLGPEWDKYKAIKGGKQIVTSEEFYALSFNDKKYYSVLKMTPRLLLQLLGTDCGRDIIHPLIWVNSTMSSYKHFETDKESFEYRNEWFRKQGYDPNQLKINAGKFYLKKKAEFLKDIQKLLPDWTITDVRFPDEVYSVQDKGGIVVRIEKYPNYIYRVLEGSLTADYGEQIIFDPTNKHHMDLYKGNCALNHKSEKALDGFKGFDELVDNNGSIEDLIYKIEAILIKHKVI